MFLTDQEIIILYFVISEFLHFVILQELKTKNINVFDTESLIFGT